MVRIDNYFFEVSDYTPNIEEIGNSRRGFNGNKLHTDYTNDYHIFDLTIEDLTKEQHGNLLYLLYKCRPENGSAEKLTFEDDTGEVYTVTIPIDGFDFDRQQGEKVRYVWNLRLEEVSED